jgi:hypothetical protein
MTCSSSSQGSRPVNCLLPLSGLSEARYPSVSIGLAFEESQKTDCTLPESLALGIPARTTGSGSKMSMAVVLRPSLLSVPIANARLATLGSSIASTASRRTESRSVSLNVWRWRSGRMSTVSISQGHRFDISFAISAALPLPELE